jgi:hypothetical protein
MRPEDNIKQLIENAKVRIDQDVKKVSLDELTNELEKFKKTASAETQPNVWRIIMNNKMTKFAVAAVIMAGVFLFFVSSQRSLYAQVTKSIESAKTIHVISESLKDGKWSKTSEVWYGADQGIVESSWKNGERSHIRIDNGQYMWIYNQGNSFAKRSKTVDPIGVAKKILNTEKFKNDAVREPSKDKVVNSVNYSAYTLSNPKKTWQMTSWLDDNNRVRCWEKMRLLESGQWRKYRIAKVTYDIELDSKVFLPDFGKDVEIFEVGKKMVGHFKLDEAIFIKEELGLVFAIHELVKCDAGLMAVSSIRPADKWKHLAKTREGRIAIYNYASYQFGSNWRRIGKYGRGHSSEPISMAVLYQSDLEVQWTFFMPRGFDLQDEDKWEFEVYLNTHGKLAEERKQAGLPVRERFKPMGSVDLPEESTSLNEILNKIYLAASELEPFTNYGKLTLKSIPFTDEEMDAYVKEHPNSGETREYRSGDRSKSARLHHGQSDNPSKIEIDDWYKDRLDYLEERNDIYNNFLEEVKRREMRDQK